MILLFCHSSLYDLCF